MNYWFLRIIQRCDYGAKKRTHVLTVGVGINLISLIFFKIISTFWQPMLDWADAMHFDLPGGALLLIPKMAHVPLGLSFLTLQLIGMLVDASKQKGTNSSGVLSVLNFSLMFPKVIAGPISSFREKTWHIQNRTHSVNQTATGLRRFIFGFAKKTLIADQLALVTNGGIFIQPPQRIPTGTAWLVILCYMIQIYVDFSAYSDMAIGLGKAIGYDLPENFDTPYLSTSITNFWRRWHISLTNWFREYVFYPLERKRRTITVLSQSLNILIVFALTGLWHGVTLPFIFWGLLHGMMLVLERSCFGEWLRKIPRIFQHVYVLAVVGLGWVFFRSPTLLYAWGFLKTLLGITSAANPLPFSVFQPVGKSTWVALGAGILIAFSIPSFIVGLVLKKHFCNKSNLLDWACNLTALILFICSGIVQAGTHYSPFIYGGF